MHWHLIYTPGELSKLDPNSLSYAERMCASNEMGKGGAHYHIYLHTEYHEDKIRDTLKEVQKIPTGKKGVKSRYYSLRKVEETHKDFPETDFQKFTLGYTLKNQDEQDPMKTATFTRGYTSEELKEAYDYYMEKSNKTYKAPEPINVPQGNLYPEQGLTPREVSIQDQWLEYSVAMMKGVNELTRGIDIKFF